MHVPQDPLEFVKALFKFTPTQYQEQLLRDESKRIVVRWSRQAGKTTTIALRAIWFALTHDKTLSLIVAPSLRQSMIMGDRVQDYLASLPRETREALIEKQQRIIFHGLQGYFKFDRPLVEEVGCQSELDLAVVNLIFESGSGGILAKDIPGRLPEFGLERHKVLRIVRRVNHNVEKAFGRPVIEKRGKKWAFTSFGVQVWGKSKEDAEGTFTDSWEKGEVRGEES